MSAGVGIKAALIIENRRLAAYVGRVERTLATYLEVAEIKGVVRHDMQVLRDEARSLLASLAPSARAARR